MEGANFTPHNLPQLLEPRVSHVIVVVLSVALTGEISREVVDHQPAERMFVGGSYGESCRRDFG